MQHAWDFRFVLTETSVYVISCYLLFITHTFERRFCAKGLEMSF